MSAPMFLFQPEGKSGLVEEYTRALAEYMEEGGESWLRRAAEIGRRAAAEGVDVIEIAGVHHRAMMALLLRALNTEQNRCEVEAVGMFCASCPAWYTQQDCAGQPALESFFAASLSELASLHHGLRKANLALRRLNEVREEEGKRIAHALHDESAQLLASVHIAIEEVARGLEGTERDQLRDVHRLLDRVEGELRRLAHELRPAVLDDFGLTAALRLLAEGVSIRKALSITVDASLNRRLPLALETVVYRTVQEALNNVAKHAQATQVRIELKDTGGTLACAVRDDGVGFDLAEALSRRADRGLGLAGIRERLEAFGGTCSIQSSPGRGTTLCVTIPLDTPNSLPDQDPAECPPRS